MKHIIYIPLLFLLGVNVLHAAPSINSVSGPLNHKGSITLSGSDFGSKSPAAPLIWDDCEGRAVNSDSAVASVWDEVSPIISLASVQSHRTRYRRVPFEGVAPPHNRSTSYLAGGHYQYPNNNPSYIGSNSEHYRDVLVTVDAGSVKTDWFATWYYRVHPDWRTPCPADNNHKYCVSNSGATAWDGQAYDASNATAPCVSGDISIRAMNGGCSAVGAPVNNPRLDWIRYERRWGTRLYNGFRQVLIDNEESSFMDGCGAWQGTRSFSIGGYYRHSSLTVSEMRGHSDGSSSNPENNSFRYFDDMYVDTTYARVMLGDASRYDSCRVLEPQIPSSWSNNSIAVTVNLGNLPAQATVYLFVFDSNNNHNSTGYPVTIGGGSIDTIPPNPPTGLRLEDE